MERLTDDDKDDEDVDDATNGFNPLFDRLKGGGGLTNSISMDQSASVATTLIRLTCLSVAMH